MKKIIFISMLFLSVASSAARYQDATVVFSDGTSKTGLVENPFGGEFIFFKASEDATVEKLESARITSITFTIKGEKKEYHQVKVYLGWGQKRISGIKWLEVVEKGIATLYVERSRLSAGSNQLNSAGFLDYFVIRKGEPAAKMIANVSTMNNNQTFRAKAPLYFQDYPELAAKIESKEYTWKDLVPVIQEYNKWAAKK